MSDHLPEDWKKAIFKMLEKPGRVMVSGPVDSGKTTFCLALANACTVRNISCTVIDADPGQSDIGPPTTIGYARVQTPIERLSLLKPEGIFFIGSTSPANVMSTSVAGLGSICHQAAHTSTGMTIIDMPGLVDGQLGRKYVESSLSVSWPDYFVVISKLDSPLAAITRGLDKPEYVPLRPSEHATARPSSARSTFRQTKMGAYLTDSDVREVSGTSAAVCNCSLFSAPLAPMNVVLKVESLGIDPVHSEEQPGRLLFVLSRPAPAGSERKIEGWTKVSDITLVNSRWFQNILVGLADSRSRHVGLGVIEDIDWKTQMFRIRTPVSQLSSIRQIIFGTMRVSPNGRELGHIDPARFKDLR